MDDKRYLIQVASQIQEAMVKLRNERYRHFLNGLTSFNGQMKELCKDSAKLGKALSHKWYAAAQRCKDRISRLLNDISYAAQTNKQLINMPEKPIPKLSVLVAELDQLQQDCGEIDYDRDENTITIVTDPINLEDVYLGPFKIELHLTKLAELYKESPYCCIALEPNAAATSSDVTHPHVSNDKLCEGDGSVAIRTALEQGRLTDFFTMVINILNTYNPDSPYVSLYDWDGTPCYDCGYVCDRENCYYCTYCEHEYCEECSSYCRLCDEMVCLGCGGQCPHCEDMVCPNCISKCAECGGLCCKGCLEENLCPNCKEDKELEHDNEDENTRTNENKEQSKSEAENSEIQPSCPEVQPNSVGEAIVLQG